MTAINLRTLKRLDPGIEEILQSVCHVCLYQFSIQSGSWQHKRIEGPLHLYRKGSTYGFMILNRNDMDHHDEVLTHDFELALEDQFFEYKNDRKEIFCIWFYQASDAEKMYNAVTQLKPGSSPSSKGHAAAAAVSAAANHFHSHHHHHQDQHQEQQQQQPGIMDILIRGYQKRIMINGDARH